MLQSNCCRLCINMCNGHQSLYDENGQPNEIYELVVKYFTSALLEAEWGKDLKNICMECWSHIVEFQTFQQSILLAQRLVIINNKLQIVPAMEKEGSLYIDEIDLTKLANLETSQGQSYIATKYMAGNKNCLVNQSAKSVEKLEAENPLDHVLPNLNTTKVYKKYCNKVSNRSVNCQVNTFSISQDSKLNSSNTNKQYCNKLQVYNRRKPDKDITFSISQDRNNIKDDPDKIDAPVYFRLSTKTTTSMISQGRDNVDCNSDFQPAVVLKLARERSSNESHFKSRTSRFTDGRRISLDSGSGRSTISQQLRNLTYTERLSNKSATVIDLTRADRLTTTSLPAIDLSCGGRLPNKSQPSIDVTCTVRLPNKPPTASLSSIDLYSEADNNELLLYTPPALDLTDLRSEEWRELDDPFGILPTIELDKPDELNNPAGLSLTSSSQLLLPVENSIGSRQDNIVSDNIWAAGESIQIADNFKGARDWIKISDNPWTAAESSPKADNVRKARDRTSTKASQRAENFRKARGRSSASNNLPKSAGSSLNADNLSKSSESSSNADNFRKTNESTPHRMFTCISMGNLHEDEIKLESSDNIWTAAESSPKADNVRKAREGISATDNPWPVAESFPRADHFRSARGRSTSNNLPKSAESSLNADNFGKVKEPTSHRIVSRISTEILHEDEIKLEISDNILTAAESSPKADHFRKSREITSVAANLPISAESSSNADNFGKARASTPHRIVSCTSISTRILHEDEIKLESADEESSMATLSDFELSFGNLISDDEGPETNERKREANQRNFGKTREVECSLVSTDGAVNRKDSVGNSHGNNLEFDKCDEESLAETLSDFELSFGNLISDDESPETNEGKREAGQRNIGKTREAEGSLVSTQKVSMCDSHENNMEFDISNEESLAGTLSDFELSEDEMPVGIEDQKPEVNEENIDKTKEAENFLVPKSMDVNQKDLRISKENNLEFEKTGKRKSEETCGKTGQSLAENQTYLQTSKRSPHKAKGQEFETNVAEDPTKWISDEKRYKPSMELNICQYKGSQRSAECDLKSKKRHKRPKTAAEFDKFLAQCRPNLECVVCHETCSAFSLLFQHFKEQHPLEKCHILCCQHKFYYPYEIEAHISYKAKPVGMYTKICKFCSKDFKNTSNLNAHIKRMHAKEGEKNKNINHLKSNIEE